MLCTYFASCGNLWKQDLRGEDVGELDQNAAELGGDVIDKNDFNDDEGHTTKIIVLQFQL